jgi:hypothetical protein
MSLDNIVQVTITAQTQFPSRAGFGRPLIAGYHTVFPERTRVYNKPSDMVADGFAQTDVLVRLATKLMSQTPRPTDFKIGRRALPMSQAGRVTPTNTDEGAVQTVTITHPDGTDTVVTYTNGAAETVASICTALQPLITAVADLTAVDNVTHVSWSADNNGELFDFSARSNHLLILDETANPGVQTDLAAIRLEDPDWYGLLLDSNSKAEVDAAATWAEAETVIFGATTADDEVLLDTAGNIAETLHDAAIGRTYLFYHQDLLSGAAHALMGLAFPRDPGSLTWKFKTPATVPASVLTATQITNLEANDVNYLTTVAGVNITQQGTTADGDFIDIQRTIDALSAGVQEDVAGLLFSLPKLPYTDGSVSTVKGTIRATIGRFQASGALALEPAPLVTAPLVADVAAADRAARLLPDVEFQATLAGAIHKITIEGTLLI